MRNHLYFVHDRSRGGRLSRLFVLASSSTCESESVSCRLSEMGVTLMFGVGLSVGSSWLVSLEIGELVMGVIRSGLFVMSGGFSGECLFAVSSLILFCILGLIFGLGCPFRGMGGGGSPLGSGGGWLWPFLVL